MPLVASVSLNRSPIRCMRRGTGRHRARTFLGAKAWGRSADRTMAPYMWEAKRLAASVHEYADDRGIRHTRQPANTAATATAVAFIILIYVVFRATRYECLSVSNISELSSRRFSE
jgi:hypothetical protein